MLGEKSRDEENRDGGVRRRGDVPAEPPAEGGVARALFLHLRVFFDFNCHEHYACLLGEWFGIIQIYNTRVSSYTGHSTLDP